MTTFTEALHPGAFIVSERDGFYSRDAGRVAPSQAIVVGQVLGRTADLAQVAAAASPAAGNTGDGALTLDGAAPARGDVIDGVYTVEFLTAGAAATFQLTDPDGKIVGTGAVGTLFVGPLKFTVADDAAHHYAVGDRILISVTVPVSATLFKALDPAAVDGSTIAAAVAIFPAVTGAGQTAQIAVLVREAEVRASDLTWPAGATAGQIAEGIVQLRRRGIVAR